jgi:hypothetical protein
MAKSKKLSLSQRNKIADKLMTWANMVFAGLVIAQVFSKPFSVAVALAGVVLFVGAYILSVSVMRGGGGE